jgi:hypothetical protein
VQRKDKALKTNIMQNDKTHRTASATIGGENGVPRPKQPEINPQPKEPDIGQPSGPDVSPGKTDVPEIRPPEKEGGKEIPTRRIPETEPPPAPAPPEPHE